MTLSRRDFLKISALSAGGLVFPRSLRQLQQSSEKRTPIEPAHEALPLPTHSALINGTTIQVIGDLHIDAIASDRLFAILDDVPETPDQIVQVGDLTDLATQSQDAAAIGFLGGLPYYLLVCGGHDVWADARTPEQWAATYGMPGQNYVAEANGVRLIVLGVNNVALPQYLSAEQLVFLETSLQEAPDAPCLIFCHQPLYHSVLSPDPARFYDSTIRQYYTHEDAAIRGVLARHNNAKAWISGHTHSPYFAEGFLKLEQVGTHHMLMVNASSPHYTDRLLAQDPSEPVATVYLTIGEGEILARVRDHLSQQWIKQDLYKLQTNLAEPAVILSDPFTALGNRGILEIQDDNSVIGLSGGLLKFSGTSLTPGQGCAMQAPLLRKCGRAMRFDVRDIVTLPTQIAFGLGRTKQGISDIEIGFDYAGANKVNPFYLTPHTGQMTLSGTGPHSFICTMRSKGGLLLGRNITDPAGQYTLLHVYGSGDAPLYASVRLQAKAILFNIDNLWVGDLGGQLADDWGAALVHVSDTLDGDTFTATGNGWFEHTVQAQVGTIQEIMFRRTDDLNTWIARIDFVLGEVSLWSRWLGVDTLRGGPVAVTFFPETEYRISIYCNANVQRLFVDDVYKTGANSGSLATSTSLKVSHAGRDLAAWPLTITVP
jgi:predicted phosphodiesterase